MKIAIIGYKNHSKKILNLCLSIKEFTSIIVFCHNSKNLKKLKLENYSNKIHFTDKLEDTDSVNGVLISSPNKTHVDYIKYFLKKNIYIFCEKPPSTNKKNYSFLINLETKMKKKIFFNYNFQVSKFKENLKNLIMDKKNGKTNYVSLNISHGIAFNRSKYKSWRKKQENIFDNILGNLGIHYIELMVSLYGKVEKIKTVFKKNANQKSSDTGFIYLEFKKNVIANMYFSYAGTFEQNINFYLSNSIIKVINNKIKLYFPRDTYDKSGKFTHPKIRKKIIINNLQAENLMSSIIFFKNTIKNKKNFNLSSFNHSLYVNKLLLDQNSNFKKFSI